MKKHEQTYVIQVGKICLDMFCTESTLKKIYELCLSLDQTAGITWDEAKSQDHVPNVLSPWASGILLDAPDHWSCTITPWIL
jgi:hypothetical protein